MKQRAVNFGPENALVGILTSPDLPRENAPLVLLTNAGVLPRQGPHRMNVRIARALAREGITSLRFDLSGVGDSPSLGQAAGVRAQAVLDLQSAMDWAGQATATSSFIVLGVCSGAVNAYDAALSDPRVKGLMMFDGFWYRSRWTTPVRVFKRVMDLGLGGLISSAIRHLQPNQRRLESIAVNPAAAPQPGNKTFASPPLPEFVAAMQSLVDRGTDVLLVYGGSLIDHFSYARQFKDVFGRYAFYPHVRCEYHPAIDHTFITHHAQQRMIEIVCAWASRHYSDNAHTETGAKVIAEAS